MSTSPSRLCVHDVSGLRERPHVFQDRTHAGEVLAALLAGHGVEADRVLGVPAGGVPVAVAVASRLGLPLSPVVVGPVSPAREPDAVIGAVAFDGRLRLDQAQVRTLRLREREVQEAVARARVQVRKRDERYRGEASSPGVRGARVVLVDEGLAWAPVLGVLAEALTAAGAGSVLVAVPTGLVDALGAMAADVEAVYCANLRQGPRFAVADAYRVWTSVGEAEVLRLLQAGGGAGGEGPSAG